MTEWSEVTSVLVVAAHPDDEVLGCGGTLFRHRMAGAAVTVQFLADGETSRGIVDPERLQQRIEMAERAATALGGLELRAAGFPDNQLDTVAMLDLARTVEEAITACQPRLIYTHHGADLNVDHRRAYQAVMTAARPLPGAAANEIRCFEVASSTEWGGPGLQPNFEPNLFVGLDEEALKAKKSAFDAYAPEMRGAPHPRSWETLSAMSTVRGSAVGLPACEAFMLARRVEV